jgi:hypothetical protein
MEDIESKVLTDISRAGLCTRQSQRGTTASPQLHHRQATSRRRTAESPRSECASGEDGHHGSVCMNSCYLFWPLGFSSPLLSWFYSSVSAPKSPERLPPEDIHGSSSGEVLFWPNEVAGWGRQVVNPASRREGEWVGARWLGVVAWSRPI